jgi:hypothetical protein
VAQRSGGLASFAGLNLHRAPGHGAASERFNKTTLHL